jgi:hypothetical protein
MDFTYQALTFQKNMFAAHDFTYEPLNFWEKYSVHDFPKRTSNFITIYPKNPLSMNFYVWTSKLLGNKLQPIFSIKKIPQPSIQPTRRP